MVAVSRDVRQALLVTISNNMRIHVIENGISVDYFKKKNRGCGSEEVPVELISVGRLSTQKAYPLLLQAFKIVLKEKPFLRLTIVGDGPEKENLVALSNRLEIYDKVFFSGWVADPISILMEKNFIYVCSSEFEGLPIAVLEAMAAGLPVISTNITGITTIIKDNETGFLVSRGNPQQLAQKIVQILDDDILRIRVARRGQQYIHDNYDIVTTVRQYEALYMGEKCAELP
ncbi:MAG TPA: glycosyltransferase [Candidatus Marinimicrobia bacterium]|nr:glycosyltransferase [Candidatus Neomarinimicrobiota bacterium]